MVRLHLPRPGWLIVAAAATALPVAAAGVATILRPGPARAAAVRDQQAPPSARPLSAACRGAGPKLAIVIDDIGRDPHALRTLLALPLDLTFAVLPHAAHSAAARRAIGARGREIMLHLPMTPRDREQVTDESVVVGEQGLLDYAVASCLQQVPEAVGVNNHMGSAVGGNPALVDHVLGLLAPQKLWFLDSRTAKGSVFCSRAQQSGMPCVRRDVFLDDPPRPTMAHHRLQQALSLAQRNGQAVAIGHPLPVTVALLQQLTKVSDRPQAAICRLSSLVPHGT